MSRSHQVAVIGGGIVGLATARSLLEAGARRVVVLEAELRIAAHQTGHNSGVIHSGLYYKPGSAKADACVSGREELYRYCEENGILHRRSGKLIVATRADELPRLEELRRRGEANGLAGLRILGRDELREMEPEVDGVAGMRVREAGLVDYTAVAAALRREVETRGGEVRTGARVESVTEVGGAHVLETASGPVEASFVVGCAGLQCDRLARLCGVEPDVAVIPFRGEYWELAPGARELIVNPIYPVPDPAFPFLGVHLTPTLRGTVEVGPNAVLALAREGYRRTDFSPRDVRDILAYPGFRRLAAAHWRYGLSELARSLSRRRFARSVQVLVPRVRESDLLPGKTGVRAQAVDRSGRLLDDFHILYGRRSVHVLNAPSPAATSSLGIGRAIARHVVRQGAVAVAARA